MNNDLISRSALLENYGLKNAVKYGNKTAEQQHNSYSTLMLYEIADMINDAPAADAEVVRHGRWEAVENTGLEEWCAPPIRCSNCGKIMPDVGADFCPFCGQMNAEVQDD